VGSLRVYAPGSTFSAFVPTNWAMTADSDRSYQWARAAGIGVLALSVMADAFGVLAGWWGPLAAFVLLLLGAPALALTVMVVTERLLLSWVRDEEGAET
jgi:hypothetical protein